MNRHLSDYLSFLYNLVVSEVSLSVVIPCFNEMANLRKGVLEKVEKFLSRQKFSYEVIIVDDGSTDGSREFIEKFVSDNTHFRLIKGKHTGKGGAVTTGVLGSAGEYVLFADMDQATPIEELDKLLPHFKDGYDIVIGSRNSERKGAPLSRKLMAKAAILARRTVVGIKGISDTQCGFKMFKHDVAQDLFGKIKEIHKGFKDIGGSAVSAGFDMELLLLAQKKGYRIKEVPVEWLYVETRRVSPIKDSVKGVLDILRIKFLDLRGIYEN